MTRKSEFGRRFRELTAGMTQETVADRLGISQASVSRMARDYPPGPKLLTRLVREFDLDEAEWQNLAGYMEPESEEDRLTVIATRAMEEVLRRVGLDQPSGAQRLVEGLQALNRKYGRAIPLDLTQGLEESDRLTLDRAEAILKDLEEQLRAGLL